MAKGIKNGGQETKITITQYVSLLKELRKKVVKVRKYKVKTTFHA